MSFAGFDRSDFPGLPATHWLIQNTNLKWCGFYLGPAPSHPYSSWMEQRIPLMAQGWGLAPIYVGQQEVGPGSREVTVARGDVDGKDAAALMEQAGFPKGSYVYLDLENGPPLTIQQRGYVSAWSTSLEANGYKTGVYCSFLFAEDTAKMLPSARIWAFHVKTVDRHRVSGKVFSNAAPGACGFPGAFIWQYDDEALIECPLSVAGVLLVDLDVASTADPSS